MRILNLSTDSGILKPESKSAKRMIKYGAMVDSYAIIVFAAKDQVVRLSDKVMVSGVGGNRLLAMAKMFFLADKLIKENKIDVITSQDPFELALFGLALARWHHIGLNIQEHGDFFSAKYWRNENIKNFCRYYLGFFTLPRADSVRAVSERIKKNLISKLRVREERIVVVPVFVDLKHEAVKNPISLPAGLENKTVILTMARLVKQKNLPLLLKSFNDVQAVAPETVLVIVGRGREKDKLVELTAELKLQDKVIFIDWTQDIYSYYEAANIYALSSNYEGWGMVIIEAASCGLPVVMTDVGCANEVIKDGESGLIVPIDDQGKLSAALIEMINNKELRAKVGANAQEAILKLPDQAQTLELYFKSWRKALQNK